MPSSVCVALLFTLFRAGAGSSEGIGSDDAPEPALCACTAAGESTVELYPALRVYSCPCQSTAPPVPRIGIIPPEPNRIGVAAAVQPVSDSLTTLLLFAGPLLDPARKRLVAVAEVDQTSRTCCFAAFSAPHTAHCLHRS